MNSSSLLDRLRSMSTRERLRQLEALALSSTVGAFGITILLVTTGTAQEMNPVAAGLLDTVGWTVAGLLALVVEAAAFEFFTRAHGKAPRVTNTGAAVVAAVGVVDVSVNLYWLAKAGVPHLNTWGVTHHGPSVVAVSIGALLAYYRDAFVAVELGGVVHKARKGVPVALALLVILSGMPFGLTQNGLVQKASAQSDDGPIVIADAESGTVNTSVWTNGAGFIDVTTSNVYDGSYSYVGQDEYAQTPLATFTKEKYSSISWAYKTNSTSNVRFYVSGNGGLVDEQLELYLTSDGSLVRADGSETYGSASGDVDTGIDVPIGEWFRIDVIPDYTNNTATVGVYDKNGDLIGEKSGVQVVGTWDGITMYSWRVYDPAHLDNLVLNSTGPSSAVTGQVTSQSGTPVANATVVGYAAQKPDVYDAKNTLSNLQDPIPDEYDQQVSSSFELLDGANGKFNDIDAEYVGVYSESDVGKAPWVDSTDLTSPMWANVPANEELALVVGDPTIEDGNFLTDNEYNRQVPGDVVDGTAVIEKLGPTGEVVNRMERDTDQTAGGGYGDPSELRYATVELTDGIYRVSAKDSDFSYLIKVGDPLAGFEQSLDDINGTATARSQAIQDEIASGGLTRVTTTTNATGHYTLDVPAGAKAVTVTARKAPGVPVSPQNLTDQDIRDHFETAEGLRNTSVYLPSSTATAEPPASNVDLTMVELSYPPYGNVSKLQDQLALLEALFNAESLSELPPALQQQVDNLTREEMERTYERMNEVVQRNNELRDKYEDLLNDSESVDIDVNSTSDAELRERITKLQQSVTELQTTIDAGEQTLDRGNDSVTWKQQFNTPLEPEDVLVRAHYSNGTSEVVGEEYISIDSSVANVAGIGSSSVVVEDYPLPSDIAGVRFEVVVANEDGVGKASESFTNPAFDDEVPELSSVSLSSLSPGPNDTVRMKVNPGEDSTFRSVSDVTVYGANGQVVPSTLDNSTGEMTFTTVGEGVYTARVTFEDYRSRQHVLPVRIKSASADRNRPAGIRAVETPFGVVAQVGEGIDGGDVELDSSGGVTFTAQIDEEADVPSKVHVYDTGMSLSPDATRTVRVTSGDTGQSVDKHVEVVYHTARLSDDSIIYRGKLQPITKGEPKTRFGRATSTATGTTIETWTDEDGELQLRIDNSPTTFERTLHWVRVRIHDYPVIQSQFD